MTKFTEGRHPGEFLLSEANFHRSRGRAVIAAGVGVFEPGTVIGALTAGGKFAPSGAAAEVGFEGAETATAIALYGGNATTDDVEVAIIERDAEVNGHVIVFDASVDTEAERRTKVEQLKKAGIIVRY